MELEAIGQLLFVVVNCQNSGRIRGKAKALVRAKITVLAKIMSKGMTELLYSHQMTFKISRAATKKPEVIHISQVEISSRISEGFDWTLIKSQSLDLCKSNIHTVTCNDVQAFKHSGGEKLAEFSSKTNKSVKLATG